MELRLLYGCGIRGRETIFFLEKGVKRSFLQKLFFCMSKIDKVCHNGGLKCMCMGMGTVGQ